MKRLRRRENILRRWAWGVRWCSKLWVGLWVEAFGATLGNLLKRMVGLGGLEPPTSPLSGGFYGAICIVHCRSWTEIDAIGPKHFDALGPLILNAKASRIPYEHGVSISQSDPEAESVCPAKQGYCL